MIIAEVVGDFQSGLRRCIIEVLQVILTTRCTGKRPSPMDSSYSSSDFSLRTGEQDGRATLYRSLIKIGDTFMNDEFTSIAQHYIETPPTAHRPERIDTILKKRMKDFLLTRQQKLWQEGKL